MGSHNNIIHVTKKNKKIQKVWNILSNIEGKIIIFSFKMDRK